MPYPFHAAFSGTSKIDPGQFPLKLHNWDDQSTFLTTFIERTKDYQFTHAVHNIGLKIGPNS